MAVQPPPGFNQYLVTFSNTGKLGFELTQTEEGVCIASVEDGGAAALSRRVFVGDRVASVNGVQPTAGAGIREILPMLQSDAVSLCLWRPEAGGAPGDGGALHHTAELASRPMSVSGSSAQSLDLRPLSILVASWNMGNKQPPQLLGSWIPLAGGVHDVIAVGLQESAYSAKGPQSVGAVPELIGSATTTCSPSNDIEIVLDQARREAGARCAATDPLDPLLEDPVFQWLQLYVGSDFITAAHKRLNEMRLIVFVRRKYRDSGLLGGIQTSHEATGIGGVYGNKGGLLVALSIQHTKLCFVSCHLAAHEGAEFLQRRNDNLREIIRGCRTGTKEIDLASQHAHAFLFGDLNYRINLDLDNEGAAEAQGGVSTCARSAVSRWTSTSHSDRHAAVLEAIRRGAQDDSGLPWLTRCDELRNELRHCRALLGWRDALSELVSLDMQKTNADAGTGRARADSDIDCCKLFPPTYKFDGETQYSAKRLPSYTDRVLWRSMPGVEHLISLRQFSDSAELCTSDHKPVSATFAIHCPPRPIVVYDPCRSPEIWITNLCCERLVPMDFNGKSDPYVRFYSHPPDVLRVRSKHGHIKRGHKKRAFPQTFRKNSTLTPRWDNKEVPAILVAQTSHEDINRLSVILALFDWDLASQDDLMGQVCIPCSKFADAGRPVHFGPLPLALHGRSAGTVEFDIEMVWPMHGRPADRKRPGFDGAIVDNMQESCTMC